MTGPDHPQADLLAALRSKRISVIVPVYNEAHGILANLDLLISEVEPYFERFEIIVISDGSTDGTADVLKKCAHPSVRAIHLERNRGKGFAVRRGFQEATGDFILFIDGGMELHPREIRVFLGLQALYDADVVVGSKRHPQSRVVYPVTRRILSFVFQQFIRHLFGFDVTDTQVGLKLFRRELIDAVKADLSIDRYGFDIEILALARQRGFTRMLEAPIRLDYFGARPRPVVIDLLHVFRVGWEVLKDTLVIFRKTRGEKPRGGKRRTPGAVS